MAKARRKVLRPLSRSDFETLLEQSKEPWRSMMVVQQALGLRPGEVCKLRVADVDLDAGTLITPRDGKTGERIIAFDPDTLGALLSPWLVDEHEYVFGGHHAMKVNSYHHAIRRYCDRAGLPGLKPYLLRHTYACELMDAGVPIATIAEALGHASPATTARHYLHSNIGALRRVNAGRGVVPGR